MRLKSSVLLSVFLIGFAAIAPVFAGEYATKQKLPDGPLDFKVEQHKAEQKLVFKLGLPSGPPPEIVQNASKFMLSTFHQWGANVEKTCASLDRYFRTVIDGASSKAQEFSPKHISSNAVSAGEHGAKVALSRAKSAVER